MQNVVTANATGATLYKPYKFFYMMTKTSDGINTILPPPPQNSATTTEIDNIPDVTTVNYQPKQVKTIPNAKVVGVSGLISARVCIAFK